jgi:ferritin-like metal-binding protein YciE
MTHDQLIWQGITALVTILTIVATYLKTRQQRNEQHSETAHKIDQVQEIVNGKNDALQTRVDQLTAKLTEHGVDVPAPPADGA